MLLTPGLLTQASQRHGGDLIMGLTNLVHYSDPALSDKVFHSGTLLKEILPLRGINKLEQQDPALAMEFLPYAFGGLGGYGLVRI